MKKLLTLAAAGTLALVLGAPALHAQNTTVTTKARNGRMTTRVVNGGSGTNLTYRARSTTNASAIAAGTRDYIYTPDPITGIIVQRPNIASPLSRDGRISVDGSVARGIRSGQPLQMVNPFAPANYGDGSDMVRREPDDPDGRPRGFKLLAFEF